MLIDHKRGTDPFYQSYEWKQTRKAFMSLPENYFCWDCSAKGKQTHATVCDHVKPKRYIEDPHEFSNLQPLCAKCHALKSQREAYTIAPDKRQNFIVWGPACSGKSTYVAQKRQPGDLVIDLDRIHNAVSLKELHARDSKLLHISIMIYDFLIDQITKPGQFLRAFVLTSNPNENEVIMLADKVSATLIKVNTSKVQSLRRLYSSDRKEKPLFEQRIKQFYKKNPGWGAG